MEPLETILHEEEANTGPTNTKDEDTNPVADLRDSPQIEEHLQQELAGKFCDFALKSHEEIRKNLSPEGLTIRPDGEKALELRSMEELQSD